MTINKLTSKLTVKHNLAVLLQYPSSHFFLFQECSQSLLPSESWNAGTYLGYDIDVEKSLCNKSDPELSAEQKVVHLASAPGEKLFKRKQWSHFPTATCVPPTESCSFWLRILTGTLLPLCTFSTRENYKLTNLQQFRCLFITKYIGVLACYMSPFLPVNNGQKSPVIIFIYYFSFHGRVWA